MGDCVICGKPAGFFKQRHAECALRKEREDEAQRQQDLAIAKDRENAAKEKAMVLDALRQDVYSTIRTGGDLVGLEGRLLDAIKGGLMAHPEMTDMLISGWEKSVESFLDDGLLDAEEEDKLVQCQNRFALSQEKLDRKGMFHRVAKSAILRRVMAGEVPQNVDVQPNPVVNFQSGETPVWMFVDCQYLEDTVRRQFVGGSQGMSFRIMSGVYYRVGGFKGESVSSVVRKDLGVGMLVVTDHNLYFVGPGKTTRIPYRKIVSFTPYTDAVGVMRDTATAKPQFFKVDDAWFAYNLITNLAKMHS